MQLKCVKVLDGWAKLLHKSGGFVTVTKSKTITITDLPGLTEDMVREALSGLLIEKGLVVAIDVDEVVTVKNPMEALALLNSPKELSRVPVKSSNIVSVGYDPESQILEIEFRGGSVYQYQNVPTMTHFALMSADSIGSFVAKEIKDAYPCKKIS